MFLLSEKNNEAVLSAFVKLMANVKSEYGAHQELVHTQDQLTQDFLHKLELETLNAVETMKLAKALRECRKVRRYHKDIIEELQPIIDYLSEPSRQKEIKQIERVLGEVRRKQTNHQNRRYVPRVL